MGQQIKNRTSMLLSIIGIAVCSTGAAIPRMTFEEKIATSDVVVLATAARTYTDKSSYGNEIEFTEFHVEKNLKGVTQYRIDVLTLSDFAEFQINCCIVGRRYILFLKRGDDGRFSPVISADPVLQL